MWLTGPGEYLGCYRSRTHPATITRCVHLSVRLLFADDNRLLRELQVSYDGYNDGKYGMVMDRVVLPGFEGCVTLSLQWA